MTAHFESLLIDRRDCSRNKYHSLSCRLVALATGQVPFIAGPPFEEQTPLDMQKRPLDVDFERDFEFYLFILDGF